MRKTLLIVAGVLALGQADWTFGAEMTREYAVQISASVRTTPPRITLEWVQDQCSPPLSYIVHRKNLDDPGWGRGISLPGTSTHFADTNVTVGKAYEYQVVKVTTNYNGYGYIYAGMELPLVEQRGRVLLVVESTCGLELSNELAQLEQDLVGDGWSITRLSVGRSDPPTKVKEMIKAQYAADPKNLNCVFLFGHVPVAYSGNIVPDGHAPDHQGAWPCDGYYGDMNGTWTDYAVSVDCASDTRNRNVPGDGKFDQSTFPAALKLMVGRVDLANMPGRLTMGGPPSFPGEMELLRNYLRKDHCFRAKEFEVPRRAFVGDYFGTRGGEAFAASGWRNFSTFFGPAQVTSLPRETSWIPTLSTNACLWAYGCGPGTFTSIGGLGNSNEYHDGVTPELVDHDVKTVFTLLFGSWLGDWDAEDDMLRAVLATPSYGLACGWSGRPHWFLHHMAMGETIGFSTRLTQNNGVEGLYQNQINNGAGQIQIALMGDPTLRMHVVAPPGQVIVSTNSLGTTLIWSAAEEDVLGYHVYEAGSLRGPFSRVTGSPVKETRWNIQGPLAKAYMVRAVKLESSGSGTYYNASQGTFCVPGAGAENSLASHTTIESRKPTGG